jgi:hypothetical protein
MKQILGLTILFFNYCISFGQINFDSIANLECKRFYQEIDSKFQLEKNNTIEFRLWRKSALTYHTTVFILTEKDNTWRSRYFELANSNNNSYWTEKGTRQSKLDSLWTQLVNNKVKTLPTQDLLKERMRFYTADSNFLDKNPDSVYMIVRVADATSYRFEIKSPEVVRTYHYGSPELYLKYNTNIEELYRAYAIISIVKRYLGIPLTQ